MYIDLSTSADALARFMATMPRPSEALIDAPRRAAA